VEILSCLQTQNNFREILSTTNDYSQTLAHLSIFYGYPSLLHHLVEWGIDLAISDINGLTALHCASMKGDLDSVRILQRGGASETVTDKLGRTPSDLQPEGFGSAIDLGDEAVAGLDTEMWTEETDTPSRLRQTSSPAPVIVEDVKDASNDLGDESATGALGDARKERRRKKNSKANQRSVVFSEDEPEVIGSASNWAMESREESGTSATPINQSDQRSSRRTSLPPLPSPLAQSSMQPMHDSDFSSQVLEEYRTPLDYDLQTPGIHGFDFDDTTSNNGSVNTTANVEGGVAMPPSAHAYTAAQQQTPWLGFPTPSLPQAPVFQSLVPPENFHPVPVNQQPQLNSNVSISFLQKLAPGEGPVGGGPTILLSGVNFPPPYQHILYARFGTVIVPTVWLLFLPPQKTNSIRRSGSIHTHSSATCLLLRLRG